jgi:putative inorganic carbon (HCO3(-)) transporter
MSDPVLARLGATLALWDTKWARMFDDSMIARLVRGAGTLLAMPLIPFVAGSWWIRHLDALVLWSVGLLFFLSPLVGTGINAALVVVAFSLLGLRWVVQPASRPYWAAIDFAVLGYAMVHVVATCFSAFWLASIKGLLKMVIYWCAYFCFRNVMTVRGEAWRWVMLALMAAGTIQAGIGVYQWGIGVEPLANWEDPETLDPLTRVYATLMNPNLLAGYLLPVLALLLAHVLIWRGFWRWAACAAACLSVVCIFFTYSRGAYLAVLAEGTIFALGALALVWANIRRKGTVLLAAGATSAALLALAGYRILSDPSLFARISSIFTLRGHSSNSFRMNVWTGVVQMIGDNFWIGVGIGNTAFRKIYSLYMISGFEALGAYNIFLEVMAEMGIVGLLMFLGLLGVTFFRVKVLFQVEEWSHRCLALAILAALVGMLVMGMVDTVYYRPAIQLQFWFLLALAWGIGPTESTLAAKQGSISDRTPLA